MQRLGENWDVLETHTLLQSHSRGIEVCHGSGEVTSGKPEVPGKPEVIRKTGLTFYRANQGRQRRKRYPIWAPPTHFRSNRKWSVLNSLKAHSSTSKVPTRVIEPLAFARTYEILSNKHFQINKQTESYKVWIWERLTIHQKIYRFLGI